MPENEPGGWRRLRHSPKLGAAACLALALTPIVGSPEDAVGVTPASLPLPLVVGWEAADGDPPDGVHGLDGLSWRPADPLREPGPRESVRWYRIRLDLGACRDRPLALYATAIRDVDETYLDGARVGGTGSFPPHVDLATMQFRLYPLPTRLVNAPGPRVLAVRVYQGPSLRPVFRFPLQVDELALTRRRSGIDQVLVALAGVGLSLAVAFALFYRTARQETVYLAFAAFSALCVVYVLCLHSLWSALSIPPHVPHRIVMVTAPLLCLLYYSAMWQMLGTQAPRRFRAYSAGFLAYALLAALAPDLRILVIPTRIVRGLALVGLAEIFVPTVQAVRARKPGTRGVLAGHLVFGVGIVWLNFTLPRAPWFYSLVGIALALLTVTLHSLGSRQVEARLAAVLAERGRMAREIHDNLAQGLVAVSLQLESVGETLLRSPETARAHVARAQGLVQSSLAEARRSVWDLHPGPLLGHDVASALAQVADRFNSGGRARVEFEVGGESTALPAAAERNLLQIGKEAVANAVTHAEPLRVRVKLTFLSGEVRLSIQDDGRGFDADRQGWRSRKHFGLLGMSERASELGGRLTIDSHSGGTTVVVVFPVAPASSRPGRRALLSERP